MLGMHYQAGYSVLPPEPFVDNFASYLLYMARPTQALGLFQLNARNYPTSPHAHDSLGNYYLAQKQPALAAAAFTKALQLKENPATRKKMAQLQTKGKK
jgi:Tfp pilus assembly protein PilF